MTYQPLRRWTVAGMVDCEESKSDGSTVTHRVVFTHVETKLSTLVDIMHKSRVLVNEKYTALGWTIKIRNSSLRDSDFTSLVYSNSGPLHQAPYLHLCLWRLPILCDECSE
jgi:hypothetical protein